MEITRFIELYKWIKWQCFYSRPKTDTRKPEVGSRLKDELTSVARERFFNRVVKTNLFQVGVWGRCKAPAGSGAEPRRQADFDNNLLKIN